MFCPSQTYTWTYHGGGTHLQNRRYRGKKPYVHTQNLLNQCYLSPTSRFTPEVLPQNPPEVLPDCPGLLTDSDSQWEDLSDDDMPGMYNDSDDDSDEEPLARMVSVKPDMSCRLTTVRTDTEAHVFCFYKEYGPNIGKFSYKRSDMSPLCLS